MNHFAEEQAGQQACAKSQRQVPDCAEVHAGQQTHVRGEELQEWQICQQEQAKSRTQTHDCTEAQLGPQLLAREVRDSQAED